LSGAPSCGQALGEGGGGLVQQQKVPAHGVLRCDATGQDERRLRGMAVSRIGAGSDFVVY
jgi:hypothetical protein